MEKRITPKLVIAILAAGMLSFLGILDETATTVAFPDLMRDFKITTDQVQWVNTLVLLVIAMIVPLSSQIRLRWSTKKIFVIGVSFFMLGILIDIFTPRFDLLLVGRALQGIGTGIGLPLMYNIILAKVPKQNLGFMMGIGTMITAAAVAFGPVFGGIITDALNWRWIFIISIFLMLIGLIAGIFTMPLLNELHHVDFKFKQWFLLAVGLLFLMLGFTNLAKNSFWSLAVAGCLAVGILSIAIWVKNSLADQSALINPRLFANIGFSMQLICYCFAKIATLALGFIFPIYVQIVNHGSISLAGWLVFPGAVVDAIMAAIAGKVYDKKGPKLPILLGICLSLIALVLLVIQGNDLTNWEILVLYAVYYGGYGSAFSSLMTSGLSELGQADQAQGNAIFNTLQQFSGAIGTALAGTIVAIMQKRESQALATATGAHITFIVLLCLIVLNLLLALKFVPVKKK